MSYLFDNHNKHTKDLWTIHGFGHNLSGRKIPYNLRSDTRWNEDVQIHEGVHILDIALPGFSSDDIDIEYTTERKLIVKSVDSCRLKSSEGLFLTEQFNTTSFACEFTVNGTVSEATMENGILSIRIETEPKPSNTKIQINKQKSEKQIITG